MKWITICIVLLSPLTFCFALTHGLPDQHAAIGIIKYAGSQSHCTATLFSKLQAITAAHCIDSPPSDSLLISFEGEDGPWLPVKATVHPHYAEVASTSSSTLHWDIAILELEHSLENIEPIPLANKEDSPQENQLVKIVGHGNTEESDSTTRVLNLFELRLSGRNAGAAHVKKVTPLTFVTEGFGNNPISTCFGDSGGPVIGIFEDGVERIIGVNSMSDLCNVTHHPRIGVHYDWIESVYNHKTVTTSGLSPIRIESIYDNSSNTPDLCSFGLGNEIWLKLETILPQQGPFSASVYLNEEYLGQANSLQPFRVPTQEGKNYLLDVIYADHHLFLDRRQIKTSTPHNKLSILLSATYSSQYQETFISVYKTDPLNKIRATEYYAFKEDLNLISNDDMYQTIKQLNIDLKKGYKLYVDNDYKREITFPAHVPFAGDFTILAVSYLNDDRVMISKLRYIELVDGVGN